MKYFNSICIALVALTVIVCYGCKGNAAPENTNVTNEFAAP